MSEAFGRPGVMRHVEPSTPSARANAGAIVGDQRLAREPRVAARAGSCSAFTRATASDPSRARRSGVTRSRETCRRSSAGARR